MSASQSQPHVARGPAPAIIDLIATLEGVRGPSRELDADISALVLDSQVKRRREILQSYVHHFGDGEWSLIPAYTASVDAALALIERVEPGFCWRLHKQVPSGIETTNGAYWATCGLPGEQDDARGPTPALALCIACLKALTGQSEAMQHGNSGMTP